MPVPHLTAERNWENYSLLEMIDITKLPDEGNVNLVNIPDLLVYIANIRKNYDLWRLHLLVSRSFNPDQSIFIQIPHIELSLSHTQYVRLLQTNDFFTRTGNRDNYSLIRKEVMDGAGVDEAALHASPRLLWKYGIRCIVRNIRKMKCSYNRAYLSAIWQHGQEYCELYREKLAAEERGDKMGKEAAARLMTCENLLPTHTILLWRTFVERQHAEEVPVTVTPCCDS